MIMSYKQSKNKILRDKKHDKIKISKIPLLNQ